MKKVLIILLFSAVPAFAQPAFPDRAQQIVVALYERNLELARGTDDQRRELTRKIVEQIICEFPNDGFGGKSADPGRPFSKDAIAKQDGGKLWAWDWQNGASREPSIPPTLHDITGQNFIPLSCVNHLESTVTPPVDTDLKARVEELERKNALLQAAVEQLLAVTEGEFRNLGKSLLQISEGILHLESAAADLYNLSDSRCVNGRVAGVFGVRSCPEPRKK